MCDAGRVLATTGARSASHRGMDPRQRVLLFAPAFAALRTPSHCLATHPPYPPAGAKPGPGAKAPVRVLPSWLVRTKCGG